MTYNIAGVPVQALNLAELKQKIDQTIESATERLHVATVNPEFIVAAQQLSEFRQILNQTTVNTADGVGVIFALSWLYHVRLKRLTGVDLVTTLLIQPTATTKIFLLGGQPGAVQAVAKRYPNSQIVGWATGGAYISETRKLSDNNEVIEKIRSSKANLLLVGFGQVKQELWIQANLYSLPGIIVAIGVGGTFDYLSGFVSRAPLAWRRLGLEWLYRLIMQPKRAGRIYRAVVKFGWLIIRQKFAMLKARK